jgi:Cu+-exporting ATPase
MSKGKDKECVVQLSSGSKRTTLIVGGMTCASCIGAVGRILSSEADKRIKSVEVTLLPGRAVVVHAASMRYEELIEMLEDGGYEGDVVESVELAEDHEGWFETRFLIEGMTCSWVRSWCPWEGYRLNLIIHRSCVHSLNDILSPVNTPGLRSVNVTLLPSVAIVVHDPRLVTKEQLAEKIEDGGYGAEVISSVPVEAEEMKKGARTVKLRVEGMFCECAYVYLSLTLFDD